MIVGNTGVTEELQKRLSASTSTATPAQQRNAAEAQLRELLDAVLWMVAQQGDREEDKGGGDSIGGGHQETTAKDMLVRCPELLLLTGEKLRERVQRLRNEVRKYTYMLCCTCGLRLHLAPTYHKIALIASTSGSGCIDRDRCVPPNCGSCRVLLRRSDESHGKNQ